MAIGGDIQAGFELALVAGRVVGKAKVNHLAVRIAPVHHKSGQVVEDD